MAICVRHDGRKPETPDEARGTLRECLSALLDLTGATAGWVGLLRRDGRLYFPARAGSFSEAWLTVQQGQASLWGFAVCDGPTLLNDPPPFAILGNPPLRNLLSCVLRRGTKPAGQLVLANKSLGFTPQDATAVQTMAHFLSRRLVRPKKAARPAVHAALLRRALDQVPEGVLIVDHRGYLVFANATWGRWTGYPIEELCGRPPPFPFWVRDAELGALGERTRTLPAVLHTEHGSGARTTAETGSPGDLLPFRHRNHSLFWCQMETTTGEIAGHAVTIAFLRRVPATPRTAHTLTGLSSRATAEGLSSASVPDGVDPPEATAMALLVRAGAWVEFWDERWEELTGLTRHDVAGVSSELLLDWLFPRQRDRSFVADLLHQARRRGTQALLEVAGRSGNRPLVCTFLPVRATDAPQKISASRERVKEVGDAWLILARAPRVNATEESRVQPPLGAEGWF